MCIRDRSRSAGRSGRCPERERQTNARTCGGSLRREFGVWRRTYPARSFPATSDPQTQLRESPGRQTQEHPGANVVGRELLYAEAPTGQHDDARMDDEQAGGSTSPSSEAVRCPQNHVEPRYTSYSAPNASARTFSSRRARVSWTRIRIAQMTSACQPCSASRTSRKAMVPKT